MKKRHAFTLIELLVVIAIVALLLSIIVPALKNAKRYAAAAACLANESQLIKSYLLYAEDHQSLIPDGDTSDEVGANAGYMVFNRSAVGESSNYRVHCWVGRPMNASRTASNTSIDDKVMGFKAGSLWPYIEAEKGYHCPADSRMTKTNSAGEMLGYRSYSIGKPLSKRYPGNPGEVACEIIRTSQFVTPSDKIVFLEEAEREYGWNHRTWNMDLVNPNWTDPFAIFHNDSSTFAFADGHADRHKWVEKQTRDMSASGTKNWSAVDPTTKTTYDWQWMKKAYIPGRKPSSIP